MYKFGLIGKHITYSFSRTYFSKKFNKEGLPFSYDNYDLEDIDQLQDILKNTPQLKGLNVTIPYKEAVIPFLDSLSKKARKIGAVNTIRITKKGRLKGYNTDCYGFKKSITPLLEAHHKQALILGTGGASKAILYVLKQLDINYTFVSRQPSEQSEYTYGSLTKEIIEQYQVIINCTPLGTYPKIDECPDIPYHAITDRHLLYDLVYNPELTKFLKLGREQGAKISNGLQMLELQASKSWSIWND